MLSCLLRSLRLLKFSEPLRFLKSIIYWLESPYFDILKKKIFWIHCWNFSEILPSLRTEAVEDRNVTFNQIKGSYIQMSTTQDSQTTFKLNLTCIFLSTRARYFVSKPSGWPCSTLHPSTQGRMNFRNCRLTTINPDFQLGWAFLAECKHLGTNHGLRTPNEGINQRYRINWAEVADKICFGRT